MKENRKQQYIVPSVDVYEVQPASIVCTSGEEGIYGGNPIVRPAPSRGDRVF